MRKAIGFAVILVLAAVPAMAQKVNIDYAHEFDFDAVKTFQYVSTDESNSKNELMARRIEDMIKKELVEGGLAEVQENPDLFVTYHVTTEERTTYSTSSFGYGGTWGGYYGWGGYPGMTSSTTTAHNYTDGTLIIDAYDAQEKKMVWRGAGGGRGPPGCGCRC